MNDEIKEKEEEKIFEVIICEPVDGILKTRDQVMKWMSKMLIQSLGWFKKGWHAKMTESIWYLLKFQGYKKNRLLFGVVVQGWHWANIWEFENDQKQLNFNFEFFTFIPFSFQKIHPIL